MADDTTPTPAPLGRARVQPNGTVDTGGGPAWVWAEDEGTGHRFDIRSTALPRKGVRVVPDYPLNMKRFGRPAKTRHQWEQDPAEREIRPAVPAPLPAPIGDVVAGEPDTTPDAGTAGSATTGKAARR